jgi:hypothetical protein
LWHDQKSGTYEECYHGETANAVAVQGKRVFVGGMLCGDIDDDSWVTDSILAYHIRRGKLLWKNSEFYTLTNDFAVTGKLVYAAGIVNPDDTFNVRAYNPYTGNRLWDASAYDNGSANAIAVRGKRVYAAGWSSGPGSGQSYIVRAYHAKTGDVQWKDGGYDDDGDLMWNASDGAANAIAVDWNGRRVFAAGYLLSDHIDGESFAVRAYHAKTGKILWEDQCFGDANSINAANAIAVKRNRVFVAGEMGSGEYNSDLIVRVYHAIKGKLLWEDQYNGSANGWDLANAIAVKGNRIFVAGYVSNTGMGSDFTVRAYKIR